MKKLLLSISLTLLIGSVVFVACSKDDNGNTKTKSELMAQSTWKFKAATANGTDISNQNPPFQACNKDNILTFVTTANAAGTGVMDEGATKCNAGDPQTVPFTWSLLNSETTLHLSTTLYGSTTNDFTLESVSETELVVSFGYTPIAGPTYLIKVFFQH